MELLPPELILTLSDHFDVQCLARFAQTCKPLHQTLQWTLTERAKRHALASEEEYKKRLLFPDQGCRPIHLEHLYRLGAPLPRQPLVDAICAGRLDAVTGFLDAGIDPDFCDVRGIRWLMHAVRSQQYDVVDVLLRRGADPSLPTLCYEGETPLYMVASVPDRIMVRKLVHAGAATDFKTICDILLPHCDVETLRLAIARGGDLRESVHRARSMLESVMRNSDPEVLVFLVDAVPEICTVAHGISGRTALWRAVFFNREDIARTMIRARIDVNHRSYFNETALHEACQSPGSFRMVEFLLDSGVDVGVPGKDMQTELHYACEANDEGIVKLLLSRGPVDFTRQVTLAKGKSPLHVAAVGCSLSVVRMLLEEGHADVWLTDHEGQTAIDRARESHRDDVTDYLSTRSR
ncbi:hypothetical protein FE257_004760 [Aspergillus nanangensis]|uniref:Ankyrin n=1 Tax=Aspergillus nanangensis TaxID=2582783 RepID=A0AAD4CR62_ASPNN|nr:hypothetical protein FE257_004760 [Aspergillus nanangensis]